MWIFSVLKEYTFLFFLMKNNIEIRNEMKKMKW